MSPAQSDLLAELVERIALVEGGQEAALDKLTRIESHWESVMVGNGKPGMMVRMDRLERADRRRGRIEWAVISVIVAFGAAKAIEVVMELMKT